MYDTGSQSLSGQSFEQMSYASRPDWIASEGSSDGADESMRIDGIEMDVPGVMCCMQQFLIANQIDFFYPDDFTIIARDEEHDTIFVITCTVESKDRTGLLFTLREGSADALNGVVSDFMNTYSN